MLNFTEPTYRDGYEEIKATNQAIRREWIERGVRGVKVAPTWCDGCAMVVDSDHPHLWLA